MTGANISPVEEIEEARAASVPEYECENQLIPIKEAVECFRLHPNRKESDFLQCFCSS